MSLLGPQVDIDITVNFAEKLNDRDRARSETCRRAPCLQVWAAGADYARHCVFVGARRVERNLRWTADPHGPFVDVDGWLRSGIIRDAVAVVPIQSWMENINI